jgi:hypothetical protein
MFLLCLESVPYHPPVIVQIQGETYEQVHDLDGSTVVTEQGEFLFVAYRGTSSISMSVQIFSI